MDLKKLICSCREFKGHLDKLLSGVEEITEKLSQAQESKPDSKLSPTDAILLADLSKQLQSKAIQFQDINDKILVATEDEDKIEEAVSWFTSVTVGKNHTDLTHLGDEFVFIDISSSPHTHGRGEQNFSAQQFPYRQQH